MDYLSWSIRAYSIGRWPWRAASFGFEHRPEMVTSVWALVIAGERVVIAPRAGGVDGLGDVLARKGHFSLVKVTPTHLDPVASRLMASETFNRPRALVIGGEALHEASLRW